MNADQIYTYLLKRKFNLRIGHNSDDKNIFYGYKNKCFHFVSFSCILGDCREAELILRIRGAKEKKLSGS